MLKLQFYVCFTFLLMSVAAPLQDAAEASLQDAAAPLQDAAAGRMKPRKPRTANTKINEDDVFDKFEQGAKLRVSSYRWGGKDYSKPSRSLGPARDDLMEPLDPLMVLAEAAPNGFPDFAGLRRVWHRLHLRHAIMADLDHSTTPEVLNREISKAIDIWRTKLLHLLQIRKDQDKKKKKGHRVLFPADFQAALDIFTVNDAEGQEARAPPIQQDGTSQPATWMGSGDSSSRAPINTRY